MSDRKISDRTKDLIAVRALIADPDNWLKNMLWAKGQHMYQNCEIREATRFCIRGAFVKIYYDRGHRSYNDELRYLNYLSQFLPKDVSWQLIGDASWRHTIDFNNRCTHKDIIALLDRAIAASVITDQEETV